MALEPKVKDAEKAEVEPTLTVVKQMVRKISKLNIFIEDQGIDPVYAIDEELSFWVGQGYDIRHAYVIGDEPDSWNILYILVKR